MKKEIKLIFVSLWVCVNTYAQYLPDMTLSSDYRAQVKSLDEFQARFNGEESKPGINADESFRRNNLLSLFDFNIEKEKQHTDEFRNKVNSFVDSVLVNGCLFHISDPNLIIECKCKMKYQGKEKKLNLLLQSEMSTDSLYRWAIVGVAGLEKEGIVSTQRLYTIDPTQHEVHFIGLQDFLNENAKHAYGYRSQKSKIDNTSVFFTLVYQGILEFDIVESQIVHYLGIPGYIFSIEEITRRGENSGWLITSLSEADINDKATFLNKILGYDSSY
jgi:hypothetical protein